MKPGVSGERKGHNDNVRVFVRVRPFNDKEILEAKELHDGQLISTLHVHSDTAVAAVDPQNPSRRDNFPFDLVLWSILPDQVSSNIIYSGQEQVYLHLGVPILDSALQGYNGCIFAYGQTSSGKTYTMMGSERDPGVIPRLCGDLFARINHHEKETQDLTHSTHDRRKVMYKVEMSFLEIYNEKVRDLLVEKRGINLDQGLPVMHDPKLGPIVKDLRTVSISSWAEVTKWFDIGQSQRSVTATAMNERSSRSHAIVQLTILQDEAVGQVGGKLVIKTRRSRINLVDLAGSEKVSKSKVEGQGLTEAININKSLTTLGRVIDALVEGGKGHIPYRDSILTSMLSDSLGGNSRTTMIATLSPAPINYEETLSTLRYAVRTRSIVNVVTVNEDPSAQLIRQLQEELATLQRGVMGNSDGEIPQVQELRGRLTETEKLIDELTQRAQEEKTQNEEREKQWDEVRANLEERHAAELWEMERKTQELIQREEELRNQHDRLQGDISVLRRQSVSDKFRFAAVVAAQQAQHQELKNQNEQVQKELVVNRLRALSAQVKLGQVRAGLGLESAATCDMCNLRPAQFRCPECDNELFCDLCDAKQHRAPHRAHKREPIESQITTGTPCDMCLTKDAVIRCSECDDGFFCEQCDELKHKNPKRADHYRERNLHNNPKKSPEPPSITNTYYNTNNNTNNNAKANYNDGPPVMDPFSLGAPPPQNSDRSNYYNQPSGPPSGSRYTNSPKRHPSPGRPPSPARYPSPPKNIVHTHGGHMRSTSPYVSNAAPMPNNNSSPRQPTPSHLRVDPSHSPPMQDPHRRRSVDMRPRHSRTAHPHFPQFPRGACTFAATHSAPNQQQAPIPTYSSRSMPNAVPTNGAKNRSRSLPSASEVYQPRDTMNHSTIDPAHTTPPQRQGRSSQPVHYSSMDRTRISRSNTPPGRSYYLPQNPTSPYPSLPSSVTMQRMFSPIQAGHIPAFNGGRPVAQRPTKVVYY